MTDSNKFILGIYDDEDVLLSGVKTVREGGVRIKEVYTPFPVHGLDEALGYRPSRLGIVAFLFGMLGCGLGLTMMFWMMGIDWPMIIGGKPFTPLPSFIPVTFELTVLIASLGMVTVFFLISDLRPDKKPKMFDIRSTDDKHVMAVDISANKLSEEEIRKVLSASGASEVNYKFF